MNHILKSLQDVLLDLSILGYNHSENAPKKIKLMPFFFTELSPVYLP